MHGVAVIAALLNTLLISYQFIIIFSIIINLILQIRAANNSLSIVYNAISGWKIAYSTNDYYSISILSSTVMSPYFIVLHFYRQNKKKQTILICRDALNTDEFRKLLVALKISGMRR